MIVPRLTAFEVMPDHEAHDFELGQLAKYRREIVNGV